MKIPMLERVENFRQFYQMNNSRALLGFFIGSEYPLHRYPSMRFLPEDRPLEPTDFHPEIYAKETRELFEQHEAFGGDFIFSANAFWGIPWLEAILGMEIYANQKTGSLYAALPKEGLHPLPETFSEDNPWVQLCGRFLAELRKESGGDFPIGTTRMRGIADLLSALYPGEEMVYRMIDEPEGIQGDVQRLKELFIGFGRYQLERIPDFYEGCGSFYYNLWAPSGTVWTQEDAASLLSPELYQEFIKQADQEISHSFGGCIMHQHPGGYMPYPHYLEMGFDALELHVDEGGPSALELSPVYNQIQGKKPLIVWGQLSAAELDYLFRERPPEGLAVCCRVQTKQEAEELYAQYGKR